MATLKNGWRHIYKKSKRRNNFGKNQDEMNKKKGLGWGGEIGLEKKGLEIHDANDREN